MSPRRKVVSLTLLSNDMPRVCQVSFRESTSNGSNQQPGQSFDTRIKLSEVETLKCIYKIVSGAHRDILSLSRPEMVYRGQGWILTPHFSSKVSR